MRDGATPTKEKIVKHRKWAYSKKKGFIYGAKKLKT
jgi:hypothetical protein